MSGAEEVTTDTTVTEVPAEDEVSTPAEVAVRADEVEQAPEPEPEPDTEVIDKFAGKLATSANDSRHPRRAPRSWPDDCTPN